MGDVVRFMLPPELVERNDVARRIAWAVNGATSKIAAAEAKAGRTWVPAPTLEGRLDQILAGALAAGLGSAEYKICWLLRAAAG
jgi:hypothetical protein